VKIWNMRTGVCETTISGHTDSVECVRWGGVGLLYTCSRDRTIKVWAIDGSGRSQQKLIRTLTGHAHRINHLALNCDYVLRTGAFQLGESVAVAGQGKGSISKAAATLVQEGNDEGANNGQSGQNIGQSGHDLAVLQRRALERYRAVCGSRTSVTEEVESGAMTVAGAGVEGGAGVGELLVSCSDDFTLFLWAPTVDKKPLVRLTGHQQAGTELW
jgi:ribosome assembly protein 4